MFEILFNPSQEKQEEPKENEIEVLQKQIAILKPEDLKTLTKEKAVEIFSNIQRVSSKIDAAKSLTRQADSVKGDVTNYFFGFIGESKAEKRSKLNTRANAMQNEAMAEMNTLIQESIKLTTISYGFAQAMTQTIAEMLVNGFKDKNGDIQRLQGVAKEQALFMLDEARKFVKHQQEYEERQKRQEEQISILQSGIIEHKEEYEKRQERQERDITTQGQRIQNLQNELESKRTKIRELESTLDSKKHIDEEQQAQINELQNRVQVLEKSVSGRQAL